MQIFKFLNSQYILGKKIIPRSWESMVIASTLKKCNGSDCNNYAEVSLLNIAYTTYSKIIQKGKELSQKILLEEQCSFRNRSCLDNVFIHK